MTTHNITHEELVFTYDVLERIALYDCVHFYVCYL